ncbi:hypothetical protein MHYP_G00101390 [Metynnis hypsauchen]
MRSFCVVIWILLSEVAVEASDIRVSGHVGGSVKINCSHQFADTNTKYFCRDPCADQHILIKSGQSPTGRYRLEDLQNGVFIVTITDLQKSDNGAYLCGVERSLLDTYTKVLLTVTDAPSTHKHPPKATPTVAAVGTVRFKFFTSSSSTKTPSTTSPSTTSSSAPNLTLPAQHSLNISSSARVPYQDTQGRSVAGRGLVQDRVSQGSQYYTEWWKKRGMSKWTTKDRLLMQHMSNAGVQLPVPP